MKYAGELDFLTFSSIGEMISKEYNYVKKM